MKKKVYLYGLRFLANLILLSASISVSQCCMGTSYQIPIDNQLKQKIKEGKDQMNASMEVMKKYEAELKKLV